MNLKARETGSVSALHRRHSDGCRTCGGQLARVERGASVDVVELIDADGNVVLCHAHGVHDDEKLRVRETILRLLRGLLA
jgi:hypothetical protein